MRLEKKVGGAEEESARKVALEREETAKFKEALDLQEMWVVCVCACVIARDVRLCARVRSLLFKVTIFCELAV